MVPPEDPLGRKVRDQEERNGHEPDQRQHRDPDGGRRLVREPRKGDERPADQGGEPHGPGGQSETPRLQPADRTIVPYGGEPDVGGTALVRPPPSTGGGGSGPTRGRSFRRERRGRNPWFRRERTAGGQASEEAGLAGSLPELLFEATGRVPERPPAGVKLPEFASQYGDLLVGLTEAFFEVRRHERPLSFSIVHPLRRGGRLSLLPGGRRGSAPQLLLDTIEFGKEGGRLIPRAVVRSAGEPLVERRQSFPVAGGIRTVTGGSRRGGAKNRRTFR